MKGDITRSTFDPRKHYRSVRMQQGRVQLDADWNEQQDITAHRIETQAVDLIGGSGGPQGEKAGFTLKYADGTLQIGAGRYYVDGLLCENETATTYTKQPDLPLAAPAATTMANPPVKTPLQAGTYLVYLDVWERHLTALDVPDMREVALGGPDTTTRTRTVWQVKLHQLNENEASNASCTADLPSWADVTNPGNGRLAARAEQTEPTNDPCIIASGAGYRRLENQLYRVEVHQGGQFGDALFKWSRDNGTITALLQKQNAIHDEWTVSSLGKDQVLRFASGQWVELTDDSHELLGQPGTLARIVRAEDSTLTIDPETATGSITMDDFPANPKVRRWDGILAATAADQWQTLEDGVQIRLANGDYRASNYWQIPARTTTADVEWPLADSGEPAYQPPRGIQHHYSHLGMLTIDDTGGSVTDCRQLYPPLTALTASDVAFADYSCLFNAATVQEAIEALCKQRRECCTLVLMPGPDWAKPLQQIPAGSDVQLCFQVGDYPIDTPVELQGLGDVKISGSGPGTRLLASKSEVALRFKSCRSVLVRDIHAQARGLGHANTGHEHLNGALTFRACGSVHLEAVSAHCGSGAVRAATCLTIDMAKPEKTNPGAGSVRIRQCALHVGHQQTGILVLNAARTHIEDNYIRASRKPRSLGLKQLLENKQYRSAVRSLLITRGRPGTEKAGAATGAVRVTFRVKTGNRIHATTFDTAPGLQKVWKKFEQWQKPSGIQSDMDLYRYLQNMISHMLIHEGVITIRGEKFTGFQRWYKHLQDSNPAVASQGIVVSGEYGRETRILNNNIHDVRQGIHLALRYSSSKSTRGQMYVGSRKRTNSGQAIAAQTLPPAVRVLQSSGPAINDRSSLVSWQFANVSIQGNTIKVLLAPFARSRQGLYIANCDSMRIADNRLDIQRYPVTRYLPVDGLTVRGRLGSRCLVIENHITAAAPSVAITAHPSSSQAGLRIIRENVFANLSRQEQSIVTSGVPFQLADNVSLP